MCVGYGVCFLRVFEGSEDGGLAVRGYFYYSERERERDMERLLSKIR